ncbi:MAG: SAM-dependent methyltransferase [Acidimicrobiia bacterium]
MKYRLSCCSMPDRKRKPHRIFAAFYSFLAAVAEQGSIGKLRRRLLAGSYGRVLELGAGTGENLKHYPPQVTHIDLIEPDSAMLTRLRSKIAKTTPKPAVSITRAAGEYLPFKDESFDCVVSTLTLCSVQDAPTALSEAARVLKPHGRLLVFEHIESPNRRIAAWQHRLNPLWSRFAGGCHLNRPTKELIEQAGFEATEVEVFDMKLTLPILAHHVIGAYIPGRPPQHRIPGRYPRSSKS